MSIGTTSKKSIWPIVWHLHNQSEFPFDVSHSSKASQLSKLSNFPRILAVTFWSHWSAATLIQMVVLLSPLSSLLVVAWSLMGKWSSIHRVTCGQFLWLGSPWSHFSLRPAHPEVLVLKAAWERLFCLWKLLWCKQLKERGLCSCLSGDNRELMQGLFVVRLRMQARVRAEMEKAQCFSNMTSLDFQKSHTNTYHLPIQGGNLSVFLSMIMILRLITLTFLVKTLPCSLKSLWLCPSCSF